MQSLPFHKSLVIIPTYNEADNVKEMVRILFDLYPGLSILVIDDNSPDGTGKIVRDLQQGRPNLHLVEREGKLGLGTAYVTGFKWALARDFEYVIEMDCDFSHDPKEISNFLEAAQSSDLVIGSRYVNGIRICNWSMGRLLLSYAASIYVRLITSMPLFDTTGGFKCISRKALLAIELSDIRSNGYSFQVEVNYKIWSKGLRVKEIPITFYERRSGQSKMSKNIIWEALFIVFKLRLRRMFGIL